MRRVGLILPAALAMLALIAPAAQGGVPALNGPAPALTHVRQLLAKERRQHGAPHLAPAVGQPEISFRSGTGYQVHVFGDGDNVVLAVAGGDGLVGTAYVVRGTAVGGRLRARFSGLGRIDMRFRPASGRAGVGHLDACDFGQRLRVRRGVFVGRFRFRGEENYLNVDSHRLSGTVGVVSRCGKRHGRSSSRDRRRGLSARPGGSSKPERGEEWSYLHAHWREGGAAVSFVAGEFGPGEAFYVVDSIAGDGPMAVIRTALSGPSNGFSVSDRLISAKVSPPAPFHGHGRYQAKANGSQAWDGNLFVDFPGHPDFPLTGVPPGGRTPYELEVDRTANPFLLLFLLLS